MLKTWLAVSAVAACAVAMPAESTAQGRRNFPTGEQFASSAAAQRHVEAARRIAGTDLVDDFNRFCTATGPLRPALVRQQQGLPRLEEYVVEPTKVFDNMYYLGFNSQNSWAIATSDGIILIDTLNSTDEARDVLVPGLRAVGLDPAQVKKVIVMHGHPGQTDHTGGANYFQAMVMIPWSG